MFSPIEEVCSPLFEQKNVRLLVKRDDLLHPVMGGNKWRKLKHNLAEARRLGFRNILTWGGAYSNHIAAVAAAGKEHGFSTKGIIRGERCGLLNPTLRYVEECGMELFFTTRANFKEKNNISMLDALKISPAECYLLPEGGANCFGLQGCREVVEEVRIQLGGTLPDYFLVPCGTGTTLAGIVAGIRNSEFGIRNAPAQLWGRPGTGLQLKYGMGNAEYGMRASMPVCSSKALGVSVLAGNFMKKEVERLLENCGISATSDWDVLENYHFGGYAKFKPELVAFINDFKRQFGFALDPVYTGKLFFAIFDLVEKGFFEEETTLLAVHTGGLQGIEGFNERFGQQLEV